MGKAVRGMTTWQTRCSHKHSQNDLKKTNLYIYITLFSWLKAAIAFLFISILDTYFILSQRKQHKKLFTISAYISSYMWLNSTSLNSAPYERKSFNCVGNLPLTHGTFWTFSLAACEARDHLPALHEQSLLVHSTS